MKKYIFIFCIIPIFQLYSQELINTEGKDFWLTFLPNYHNTKTINETDSLYIFVSAQKPTKGEIIYRNINGALRSKKFEITDPSVVYTFAVSFFNYELQGFNNSGTIDTNNQCERAANQYFRVVTEENVTVYALNQANLTSEAFLVLPSNVLGNEYYILTYNSDGKMNFFNQVIGTSTPSQFTVLAIEDSTLVEIKPSDATYKNGINKQKVWLNAGESYLVQARISTSNTNRDLTGSYVKSTKPIAVFAGHQRAT
ncbi:MAG: IgGFc-binding protein, partial [Ignavibacteria bacterium]|nr:IgGFc-binding protein [Ignavibacteria bacterium]